MLLVATSLGTLRTYASKGSISTLREAFRRTPGSIAAYIIGGLALGGFPLSSAFATRWLIYRSLPGSPSFYAWALLLSGCGVVLGYLKSLFLMLKPSPESQSEGEPRPVTVMMLCLILLCLLLALAPRLIVHPLSNMVQGMVFIGAG